MPRKSSKSTGRSANKGRLVQFKSVSPLLNRFFQGLPAIYPVLKPLLKGSWKGPLLEKVRALAICDSVLRKVVPTGLDRDIESTDAQKAAAQKLRELPEINEVTANHVTLDQVIEIYLSVVPLDTRSPFVSIGVHALWLGTNALARAILGTNYDRATTKEYVQLGKEAAAAYSNVEVLPDAYDIIRKDLEALLLKLDGTDLTAGILSKMGTPAAAVYGSYVYTHGAPGIDPTATQAEERERELKILIRDENSKARPNQDRLHSYRNALRVIQGFPPNLPRYDKDKNAYEYGLYGMTPPFVGRAPYASAFVNGAPSYGYGGLGYGFTPFGDGALGPDGFVGAASGAGVTSAGGAGFGGFGGFGGGGLSGLRGYGGGGLSGLSGFGGFGGGGLSGYGYGGGLSGLSGYGVGLGAGALPTGLPVSTLQELDKLIEIEARKARPNELLLAQLRHKRMSLLRDPAISRPDLQPLRERLFVLQSLIQGSKKNDPQAARYLGEWHRVSLQLAQAARQPYAGPAADPSAGARAGGHKRKARGPRANYGPAADAQQAAAAAQQAAAEGNAPAAEAAAEQAAEAADAAAEQADATGAPEDQQQAAVAADAAATAADAASEAGRTSNPRHLARHLRSSMSHSRRAHNPDYSLDSGAQAVAEEARRRFLRATGGR